MGCLDFHMDKGRTRRKYVKNISYFIVEEKSSRAVSCVSQYNIWHTLVGQLARFQKASP